MLNNTLSSLSSTLSEEQKKELALLIARGKYVDELSSRNCDISNNFYSRRYSYRSNYTAYDLFESLGMQRYEYSDICNDVSEEEHRFLTDYSDKITDGCIDNKIEEKTKCLLYYQYNLPYFYTQLNYMLMYKSYHAAEDQLESKKYKKRTSLRAGVNYDIIDIEDVRDDIYKSWLNNPDALIAYFVGKCLVTTANWNWFIQFITDYASPETIKNATFIVINMLCCSGEAKVPVFAKALRKSRVKKAEDNNTFNADKSEE